MSEFRWLLAAAGVLILLLVFWLSRRDSRDREPLDARALLRRGLPRIPVPTRTGNTPEADAAGPATGGRAATEPFRQPAKIVTVRLTARGAATFPGETVILALREAGLRHGKFGIFHRHEPSDESRLRFSVASLVEPGSFDLTRLKVERLPGVTFFLALPGPVDGLAAFDDMLATAHALATALDAELLDEHGSRLSVQRERFLREEVIQLQHRLPPS